MNRRQIVLGGLGLGVAATLLPAFSARVLAADPPAGLDESTGLFLDDRTLGNPGAKVVLIEYASLSCPHCANFHTSILPRLKTDWIEPGKLLYVYRHFPLNAPALWAAMVTECQQGEGFFGLLDLLFQQQQAWLTAEDTAGAIFEVAQLAGFDRARFDQCVNDQEVLNRILDRVDYATARYDVKGTPTIILNGEKVQPKTYEDLSKAIEILQG